MTPTTSGGLLGFFAGPIGLALVHAIAGSALLVPIGRAAQDRGVALEVAVAIAYGTTAAFGALLGAAFSVVTRYLEKWVPLVIWAVVFFVSLAMLVLAAGSADAPVPSSVGTTGAAVSSTLAPAVLLAAAVFAVLVSFSLPIRRRR